MSNELSNSSSPIIQHLSPITYLSSPFIALRKPDAEPVHYALAQIGVDPQDAVYIGDSEVDVATAHNSGMPCISVTWGFRDKETLLAAGATTLCDTAEEMVQEILK